METKHNPFEQLAGIDQDRLIALIRAKGDFIDFCQTTNLPLRDALAWRCEPHISHTMQHLQDAEHTLLVTTLNAARAFCIEELQKTIAEFRSLYKAAQPEVLAHIQRVKNIAPPQDSTDPPSCIAAINACFNPLIRAFSLLSKLTGIGPVTAAQLLTNPPNQPSSQPNNQTNNQPNNPPNNPPNNSIKFTNTKSKRAHVITSAAINSLQSSNGAAPPTPTPPHSRYTY